MHEAPSPAALKTADVLRRMFEPHAVHIEAAFIFGSVARGTDTARSDIDLMIVGALTYDAVYEITDEAGRQSGRPVSPIVLSPAEWRRQAATPRSLESRVHAGPKLVLFGREQDL